MNDFFRKVCFKGANYLASLGSSPFLIFFWDPPPLWAPLPTGREGLGIRLVLLFS
jgi:hypothetical protein